MKKLILVNGTMGVGKTTVCSHIFQSSYRIAFLDGDWCGMMHPFENSENNSEMIIENVVYILNNYLENPSIDIVLFCWVMHDEKTIDSIELKLNKKNCEIYKITLQCEEKKLIERMKKDNRQSYVIDMSVKNMYIFNTFKTIKIDTSKLAVEEVSKYIKEITKI